MDSNGRTYACNRELTYHFMCDSQLTNFLKGLRQAPRHAADHSPPSSATVMEEYSYTSTYLCATTRPVMGTLYLRQAVCNMHQDNRFYNLQKDVHCSSIAFCIL